jgi:hypothetical protein
LVRKTKGFAKKVRRLTKHYGFFQMYRNFMWADKNGMTPAMKEDLSDMPMTVRHEVAQEMRVSSSKLVCRNKLQTTSSCTGQESVW